MAGVALEQKPCFQCTDTNDDAIVNQKDKRSKITLNLPNEQPLMFCPAGVVNYKGL